LTITKRRLLEGGAAAVAASLFAKASWAQRTAPAASEPAWPTKPVRILVGFPAGASPDLATRAIAEPLSKILRQPVVVENKPGASGNTVADLVAKATDEHTIGALINGNLTIAKLLNPKLPFDPEKDFAPVGLIGTAPLVLAVSGNAEGKTAADQLLWVRNLGSGGKYGTPGVGTVGHLGMELIKSRAAITAQHKPYTGNPQVIAGLLANEIQLALSSCDTRCAASTSAGSMVSCITFALVRLACPLMFSAATMRPCAVHDGRGHRDQAFFQLLVHQAPLLLARLRHLGHERVDIGHRVLGHRLDAGGLQPRAHLVVFQVGQQQPAHRRAVRRQPRAHAQAHAHDLARGHAQHVDDVGASSTAAEHDSFTCCTSASITGSARFQIGIDDRYANPRSRMRGVSVKSLPSVTT
jgi:tripartite-type tricarboxylate transporter receptor subunit TctC